MRLKSQGEHPRTKPRTTEQSDVLQPQAKYEMNLAEFPLAILSKRLPQDCKAIEYEDTITGKDGAIIPRKWKVTPSAEYGFGSSQILGTLFELFQIWRETGFSGRSIPFGSMYNLIKRLGLTDTISSYDRVQRDLNALLGILVEAKNAFWDNRQKAYVDKTFHLFVSMSTYHEGPEGQQPLPLASIEASKELWGSIQANAIITTSIDREWFHALSPGEQRLSLYLAKMLYHHSIHKRDVMKLGAQLPLLAKAPKKIKQQLGLYAQSLVEKDHPLLGSFHYEEKGRGHSDLIVFVRKNTKEHEAPDGEQEGEASVHTAQPVSANTQEHELVAYFKKKFFDVENTAPSAKELTQAAQLVGAHGFEKAKHIIDFCHAETQKTHYPLQFFGGVMAYTDRALAHYDKQQKAQGRLKAKEVKRKEQERHKEEARQQDEALLAQLSPEDRERLFAQAQKEVFAVNPIAKAHPEGPMTQAVLRAAVIAKLKDQAKGA